MTFSENNGKFAFDFKGGTISSNLLKASVNVMTNTACNQQYNNTITSGMVCAASPGKDSCQVSFFFLNIVPYVRLEEISKSLYPPTG